MSRATFTYPDDDDRDHELVRTLKQIRYDLTALQAKVTEALKQASEANLKPKPKRRCSDCGLKFTRSDRLEEHGYHSHGGPLPQAWQRAEELAAEDD